MPRESHDVTQECFHLNDLCLAERQSFPVIDAHNLYEVVFLTASNFYKMG